MKTNFTILSRLVTLRMGSKRTTVAIALMAGSLALVMRWYFVVHAQVMQPVYLNSWQGDGEEFYRYAWHLVHEGMFSSDLTGVAHPKPDSFRDPGYPGFLALWMLLTDSYGDWYVSVLMSQVVLGGIAVTCTLLAIRDAVPTWILAIAGVAMALWPHLVVLPGYILSENITTPMFAIAVFALGEAARRRSVMYTIVSALALSAAALANSVLAPLVFPLLLVFAWKKLMSRQQMIIFALVALAPVFGWSLRNTTIEGPFSSSFRAEVNLVQGSWPTYHTASQLLARHDPIGMQTIDAINLEIATMHFNRVQGLHVMSERMTRDPAIYIKWYLGKPALLWGWEISLGSGDIYAYPTRHSPFITNPTMKTIEAIAFAFNGVIALLALAGVVIATASRSSSAPVMAFAVTVVWVTLVYGVLQSDARYSIAYRLAEISLASTAVAAAVDYARARLTQTRAIC